MNLLSPEKGGCAGGAFSSFRGGEKRGICSFSGKGQNSSRGRSERAKLKKLRTAEAADAFFCFPLRSKIHTNPIATKGGLSTFLPLFLEGDKQNPKGKRESCLQKKSSMSLSF